MGTYLVVGGDKGVGRSIVVALRARGDLVFTAHKDRPLDHEKLWIEADVRLEPDMAATVRRFLMLPEPIDGSLTHKLDGIILAASDPSPDTDEVEMFAFNCINAFTVNVLSPLLLVRFAMMTHVLKTDGVVIFADREQVLTDTNHQYMLSKAAIPEAVNILDATYPVEAHHMTYGESQSEAGFADRVLLQLTEVPNV